MGKLVLVPTPVGNLADITLRALEILKTADLILAEDTRTSGNLLRHYDIQTPLKAFHQHNEHRILEPVLQSIFTNNLVALVSDAGTPGISDPGFLLIRACLENNIEVECLPGPTALIPALVRSGFPSDRFCFEGFLPHKKGRQSRVKNLLDETRTMIFYESPYRLVKNLQLFTEFLGADRNAAVVREISKIYEECRRGTLTELISHYSAHPPKGEIVVILSGKNYKIGEDADSDQTD